jgi:hypothetical protein
MGYTRKKRKLGKKRRSYKRRSYKRRSYKRQRYLRGGVGSNPGTPVPGTPVPGTPVPGTPVQGNSPINMNFVTPPGNNQNNNQNNNSPIVLGANNLGGIFDDINQADALIRDTDTLNPLTGSPTSVTHSNLNRNK